jgi:hypothetical protein
MVAVRGLDLGEELVVDAAADGEEEAGTVFDVAEERALRHAASSTTRLTLMPASPVRSASRGPVSITCCRVRAAVAWRFLTRPSKH